VLGVSCICATFGRVSLLEEAIESFLKQAGNGNRELLVVNDFDQQELVYDHPNIRIVNAESFKTLGSKLNWCVENASYDTIVLWDDDDIYLPERINQVKKGMSNGRDYYLPSAMLKANDARISRIGPIRSGAMAFTKSMWEQVGGFKRDCSQVQTGFLQSIGSFEGAIEAINPDEITYIERRHKAIIHANKGLGCRKGKDHVYNWLMENETVPKGLIQLKPNWKTDYVARVREFLRR